MLKTTVSYSDQERELEALLVSPSTKKSPLVLLCHAWRGRDDFICEKAERVASLGYAGFALDMYGKGILGQTKEENAALKKPFIEDRALLQRRLLKGYETACLLPTVDAARIVVLGYGFGGMCALDLARSGVPLTGAVAVYGHFEPPQKVPVQPIKAKILILHGAQDPISHLNSLHAFQEELKQGNVDWQTHLYGNASHAFATPAANDPASGIVYNPVSANRAWQAIENFLTETFI